MEHIRSLLAHLWTSPGWKKRFRAGEVLSQWEEIVGPAIARVTRPKGFSQGRLFVEVEDSVWMTRLRFEERRILSLLNEKAGEGLFREIRWVLSRRPLLKHARSAPGPQELSPILRDKASREVATIEDPELREAFLRLRLTLLKKAQRGAGPRGYRGHRGARR